MARNATPPGECGKGVCAPEDDSQLFHFATSNEKLSNRHGISSAPSCHQLRSDEGLQRLPFGRAKGDSDALPEEIGPKPLATIRRELRLAVKHLRNEAAHVILVGQHQDQIVAPEREQANRSVS